MRANCSSSARNFSCHTERSACERELSNKTLVFVPKYRQKLIKHELHKVMLNEYNGNAGKGTIREKSWDYATRLICTPVHLQPKQNESHLHLTAHILAICEKRRVLCIAGHSVETKDLGKNCGNLEEWITELMHTS